MNLHDKLSEIECQHKGFAESGYTSIGQRRDSTTILMLLNMLRRAVETLTAARDTADDLPIKIISAVALGDLEQLANGKEE